MATSVSKTAKPAKKKNFSSFSKKDAFKALNLIDLKSWTIDAPKLNLSDFFQERLRRLRQNFDLESGEEAKKLLIDALCDEALESCHHLKIWKSAALEGKYAAGIVDYLVAERKRYLETPFLCVVEAKKDDFEQGLAQCLVEMDACAWSNQELGQSLEVIGIVTNGEAWKFYKLTRDGEIYETLLYSISAMETVLGVLRSLFQHCENQLIALGRVK
ncbi:MAG: hypothetical protein F6K30_27190 [Cyanothece sp. SIO2G6]|nr:hypothetical protein [Cyanothece sp. SIO2G6]